MGSSKCFSYTTLGTVVDGNLNSNPFSTVSQPTGSSLALKTSLSNGFDVTNSNFRIPAVVNYSFGVERMIGPRTPVDVGYVASRGCNMDSSDNIIHISAG